jgi:tripartite-type tricarboxylate transporter receptor subunit TctC
MVVKWSSPGKEQQMKLANLLISAAIGVAAAAAHAQAAPWPAKPVRMIVPVAAGSTTDIIPRFIAEQLSLQLGEPVVVENRSGAGGTIGSAQVARAEADGYTVLAHGSAHTIAPALYANLTYDPARDFAAVVPFGIQASVLVASPASGYRNLGDLIAAARRKPGGLTFSSVGIGSATHLSAERFTSSAGIEALHIPFKGGAEAMTEVIAGRCDFFFAPLGLALPQIREGKVVALVVNGARRAGALPDVPTTSESGLVDAEYPIWFGLFAPAKTPRDVVERLNRETLEALQAPKVRERLAQMGLDAMPMRPEEFQAFVRGQVAMNAALVKRIGIKQE